MKTATPCSSPITPLNKKPSWLCYCASLSSPSTSTNDFSNPVRTLISSRLCKQQLPARGRPISDHHRSSPSRHVPPDTTLDTSRTSRLRNTANKIDKANSGQKQTTCHRQQGSYASPTRHIQLPDVCTNGTTSWMREPGDKDQCLPKSRLAAGDNSYRLCCPH